MWRSSTHNRILEFYHIGSRRSVRANRFVQDTVIAQPGLIRETNNLDASVVGMRRAERMLIPDMSIPWDFC